MSKERSLLHCSVDQGPQILVLDAKDGEARRNVLDHWLQQPENTRARLLSCSFDEFGVWAGVRALLDPHLRKVEACSAALLERHSYELVHVFPEIRNRVQIRNESLMDVSLSAERTRNYPTDRAYRIVHGLIDFLEACLKLDGDQAPLCLVCEDFDRSSALGRRFFLELFRRRGQELSLTLLLVVDEGQGDHMVQSVPYPVRLICLNLPAGPPLPVIDPSTAEKQACELERKILQEPAYLLAELPVIIRLWTQAGRPDKVKQWQAMSLGAYNHFGFYEDARRFSEVVASSIEELSSRPKVFPFWTMTRWNLIGNIFGSLVQMNDSAAALDIVQSEALQNIEDPLDRARVKYVQAMLYTRYLPQKDFAKAESHLMEGLDILKGLPPSPDVHFVYTFIENGLALVAHREGHVAKAIDLCSRGLERLDRNLPPTSHRLHRSVLLYNIAQVYHSARHFEKAVEFYSAAMEMDPNYADYYNERGGAFFSLNRIEEAIDDYHRAIDLSPPFPEVWTNLGQAYKKVGDLQAAITAYTRAIDLDPDVVLPYLGRAQCFESFEKWDDALTDYSEALRIDPDQPYTLSNRAVILFEAGMLMEALKDLDRAIDLAPDEEDFRRNHVILQARLATGAAQAGTFL